MSRLLFAAARGAQFCYFNKHLGWTDMSIGHMADCQSIAVIHPSDEHLQYGPISAAMRENATGEDPPDTVFALLHGNFWLRLDDTFDLDDCDDELHRSLFLLILAEALADEGL